MASDDDHARRRRAEDERTDKLHQSFREGDFTMPYWLFDMSLPAPGSRPRAEPRTVEELFFRHKDSLEGFLARVLDFQIPKALTGDWLARVEPLDLAEPEAGLAAILAIEDEFLREARRREPSLHDPSGQMEWRDRVPRVGDEIDRLVGLFRYKLEGE